MKTIILTIASISLMQIPGMAQSVPAPCKAGTLASYIGNSLGCTVGSLLVSGFTYKASASGGGAKISPTKISVTPLLAPVGNYALQFGAAWGVTSGQSQGSRITYKVTSQNPAITVQQLRLDGSGMTGGTITKVAVNEVVATSNGAANSLTVYDKCTEICKTVTSVTKDIPHSGALVVDDNAALTSKSGTAALANFTDWFITCPPCAQ